MKTTIIPSLRRVSPKPAKGKKVVVIKHTSPKGRRSPRKIERSITKYKKNNKASKARGSPKRPKKGKGSSKKVKESMRKRKSVKKSKIKRGGAPPTCTSVVSQLTGVIGSQDWGSTALNTPNNFGSLADPTGSLATAHQYSSLFGHTTSDPGNLLTPYLPVQYGGRRRRK